MLVDWLLWVMILCLPWGSVRRCCDLMVGGGQSNYFTSSVSDFKKHISTHCGDHVVKRDDSIKTCLNYAVVEKMWLESCFFVRMTLSLIQLIVRGNENRCLKYVWSSERVKFTQEDSVVAFEAQR